MVYPQIIPKSCFQVITLSAQRMSLCTESRRCFFFPFVLPRALLYVYLFWISASPLSCSISGGPAATPPISSIFTTSGRFSVANKLFKAPLERSTRLREAQPSLGAPVSLVACVLCSAYICCQLLVEAQSTLLLQEQCMCNRISFILLRASWISTGSGPGELSWVRMPGTPAVKTLAASPACNTGIS